MKPTFQSRARANDRSNKAQSGGISPRFVRACDQAGWRCAHLLGAAGLITIATILAYLPAMRGGFIWDDDAHVTRPELRSLEGLYRIWFDVGATQQYYPLLHTAFWVEHRLWGDSTVGYHLVNIFLHICVALLAMLIVRQLLMERRFRCADESALLTATIFALHPVHVESVAWITEQKNTLSALFYLSSMLIYLRFDHARRKSDYGLALILFTLGLLTKTVTATLPGALLVIFWWLRGRLSWKRDVIPLLPWFLMGAAFGLFTAWVEHNLIGAKGQAFELSVVQRMLLAARAIWFYLYKLCWPMDLVFIYPRWTISSHAWWQWVFPLTLIILLAGLSWVASRNRAPLAALMFFIGSLFPVLGFFNVFPFLFSFVADHFQYLASLGVIALLCAGMTVTASRISGRELRAGMRFSIPIIFGVLTFLQCRMYADIQTLYRTTIRRNPDCWMAYNNLGLAVETEEHLEEAMGLYRRALELRPDYPEAYNNLGALLNKMGRHEEALDAHYQAIRFRTDYPEGYYNLGIVLNDMGQYDKAIAAYQQAVRLRPFYPNALGNLAVALMNVNKLPEAISYSWRSLRLDPDNPRTHMNLGIALGRSGNHQEAAGQFKEAIRLNPKLVEPYWDLMVAYEAMGLYSEAMAAAQRAQSLARASGQSEWLEKTEAWIASFRARFVPRGS